MPKEYHRSERVSELMHRMVSEVVRNEVHDPRVRLVTITDLQLSRDLSVAKIYFTSLNDEDDLDEISEVLNRAAGFIRSQIGKEIRLRTTPELRFYKDDAELRGRQMSNLIEEAVSSDKGRAGDDGIDSESIDSSAQNSREGDG